MFEITIDGLKELEGLAQALEEFPEKVDAILVEAMKEAEGVAHKELSDEPAPIPFPPSEVRWDSEKQRRAYHATDGFFGGDPYQRDGALFNALEETAPTVSSEMIRGSVMAIEDWVKYVIGQGQDQSDIHVGRWQTIPQTGEKIRPEVIEIFNNALKRAIQEFKVR